LKMLDKRVAESKKAVAKARERIEKARQEGRTIDRTCYLTKVGRVRYYDNSPGVELFFESELDGGSDLRTYSTIEEAKQQAAIFRQQIGTSMKDLHTF